VVIPCPASTRAGFYLNEDPEITSLNYDFENKVIRAAKTGACGARFDDPGGLASVDSKGFFNYGKYMDFYGMPYYDIPGIESIFDLKDPEKARRMGEAFLARWQPSDSPVNLLATSIMMNAYLHTGEEKYKKWVLDYAGAWRKRCEQNCGLLPDNVGPHGIVGELMDGKCWEAIMAGHFRTGL